MITPEQLAQWRAVCEAATPGPWVVGITWDYVYRWPVLRLKEMAGYSENALSEEAAHDAEFVMAARTALPALLDEVERLTVEVERLERVACEKQVEINLGFDRLESQIDTLGIAIAQLTAERDALRE